MIEAGAPLESAVDVPKCKPARLRVQPFSAGRDRGCFTAGNIQPLSGFSLLQRRDRFTLFAKDWPLRPSKSARPLARQGTSWQKYRAGQPANAAREIHVHAD